MYISMALRRPDIPIPKMMSADPMIPPEISRIVTCRVPRVRRFGQITKIFPDLLYETQTGQTRLNASRA